MLCVTVKLCGNRRVPKMWDVAKYHSHTKKDLLTKDQILTEIQL